MANIKIYKSRIAYFALALNVNEISTFQIVNLEKVGQGHALQLF